MCDWILGVTEGTFVSSQNLFVKTLTFNSMVLRNRGFGRIRSWGWSPYDRISIFIRKGKKRANPLSSMWGHSKNKALCDLGEDSQENLTILTFWSRIANHHNCEKWISVVSASPCMYLFPAVLDSWTKVIYFLMIDTTLMAEFTPKRSLRRCNLCED